MNGPLYPSPTFLDKFNVVSSAPPLKSQLQQKAFVVGNYENQRGDHFLMPANQGFGGGL
jgi:hypothetical protein